MDRTDDTTDGTDKAHAPLTRQTRERIVWALLFMLVFMVGLEPFLPKYAPDPALAGVIVGGMVTLIIMRRAPGV
ncbi:hypothetical protein [Halomarina litorea]|uniref:hypothetical protein n=1 Tax=Halomarina litorea TaxID=2961595 RepID=UPI0020C38B10|nr:hypothetical protein [Halomarina sp. BCD28]